MSNFNNPTIEITKTEQLKSFFEMWYKILRTSTISIEEYKIVFELYKNCVEKLSQEFQSQFLIALFDANVDFTNKDMNQIWEVIKCQNELFDMAATLDEAVSR